MAPSTFCPQLLIKPATAGVNAVGAKHVSNPESVIKKAKPGSFMIWVSGKMFAPEEVTIDDYAAKDNVHGIGYRGITSEVWQGVDHARTCVYGGAVTN